MILRADSLDEKVEFSRGMDNADEMAHLRDHAAYRGRVGYFGDPADAI